MKPKQPKKRDPKPKEVSGKVKQDKSFTRIYYNEGDGYTIYFSRESIERIKREFEKNILK